MDGAQQQLGMVEETNEQYHGGPGISKSHLDDMAVSPFHYWAMRLNPERPAQEETPAMRLGSATHTAILEPDEFSRRYVCRPEGLNANSNAYKAWAAEQEEAGLQPLTVKEWAQCMAMRDAIHRHPVAGPLFKNGVAERSFYAIDPETGELIKCRVDYLSGMIVDLKKSANAAPDAFARSVANYRYFVQQPWYQNVHRQVTGETLPFVFVAIEESYPYSVGVYYLQPEDVARGERAMRRDLAKIIHYRGQNYWPDYGAEPTPLDLPGWCRAAEDAHA